MQNILKINLGTREVSRFEIPIDWQLDYLGGASLAARILYKDMTVELDPLSPEAPLMFLTGPLTGTSGPTVGRFVVCAKSPLTGIWGESNMGGFWGPELRKTGYDGVWVVGKAENPVYLWIDNGDVSFRPAEHLWELDTYEIQERVREEVGEKRARVVGIGIGGENLVLSAGILGDHGRVAGRTGMGAVMGSKNLKAIAVKGSRELPLDDRERYKKLRSEANRNLRTDNVSIVTRELGSASAADYFDYLGEMPKRYFSRGEMEGADKVSGCTITETILTGYAACHACVIACGRVVKLHGESDEQKGPEYETLVGFGPNLWINDVDFITRVSDLCDRYGIDTISVSGAIGFAFVLYEKGIISSKDTGGLELVWGDKEAVESLVHLTAKREGFGAYLAEGVRAMGKRFGAEDLGIEVNGLEVAYHDPRGGSGQALVYATSPRGGCHNQSDYFQVEIGGVEEDLGMVFFDRHAGSEKAGNVVIHQDWRTVFNSLVMCIFGHVGVDELVGLVDAAVEGEWDLDRIMKSGERGWNLKRVINNRMGVRRENDQLPKPLLKALPDGGSAGFEIDFEPMLEAYYEVRGWDKGTGYPSKDKLMNLGLGWTAEELWKEK